MGSSRVKLCALCHAVKEQQDGVVHKEEGGGARCEDAVLSS